MAKKLILYLQFSDLTQASYAIVNEFNTIEKFATHCPLQDIPKMPETPVIAIIPAEDVLLTVALLPKLNDHRLQQALPFALEEHIIDDPTTLHFAVGHFQPDDQWPVAIVAKQQMDIWVNVLRDAQLSPSILIPETLALPWIEATWFIILTPDHAVVRTGQYSGFACESNHLTSWLSLKLEEETQKPKDIYLHNYTEQTDVISPTLENIPIQIQQFPATQCIQDLAMWIADEPAINLLRGPYQAQSKISKIKKAWLLSSLLAVVIIALALFGNLVSYLILQHQDADINARIRHIYQQNFPEATTVTMPREHMQEKLKKVTNESNRNLFLVWTAYIGQATMKVSGVRLQRLDYRNQQMILELSTATFENLDSFTNTLKTFGLNVKQQNAVTSGAQVKANVLIQK